MQTGCRGEVARTRYVVVLVATSADRSCSAPAFNAGIDARCAALGTGPECGACELTAVTSSLKALAERYGAGEVAVQPVYLDQNAGSDPQDAEVLAQLNAVANAGGTQPRVTDAAGLDAALRSLDFGARQEALTLKRFFAFNRNTLVRDGRTLADSDGDGLADEDEDARGTDPVRADSDSDGLQDGLEVRVGLDPLALSPVSGCNPVLDADGDRLFDCEERVLGTDACMGDTDGDALPDLVEALGATNPLVAEDLADADGDGAPDADEAQAHSDPLSADAAFRRERGYAYTVVPADPTPDGRACYAVRAENVTLAATREGLDPLLGTPVPAGTNALYLYFQVGRDDDPRGAGIGGLLIRPVRFSDDAGRSPAGTLRFTPEDFILGT